MITSDADYVLWFGILPTLFILGYLWRRRSQRVKPSSPKRRPVLIIVAQRQAPEKKSDAPKPRRRAF